jgi:hypothetical protein
MFVLPNLGSDTCKKLIGKKWWNYILIIYIIIWSDVLYDYVVAKVIIIFMFATTWLSVL